MENIILINSVEDFLKLREKENSKGIIYKLMSDLDLENVDLSLTNLNFSGEFDGNNHTIRNAKYSPAKGRTGLLFKSIEDAIIKNLRFFNCTVSSNVDSIALISGILVKGYANFTNIEISYSKVETNQNYAAFLFSRNDSDKANIYLNNIVVKNLSKVKCQTYGGVLLGDVLYGSSIVIKNTKVISDFYTTSSGGFLTGRARGANIDISNTYVSGTLFGGANRTGILVGGTGGAKANNISFNNVLAKDFILKTYKGISLTGDLFTGSLDAINFLSNNVYYQNIIGYDFKSLTTKSYEIKNEIIHLGNEFDNSYNLKFESKNNYDSKFIDLIVLHDDVKKTYFKEDLDKINLTNLVVAKRYQNESIEFVDKYDIEIVDLKDTSISLSNFKDLSIGTYNIKISVLGISKYFQIDVVSLKSFKIDYRFVKTIYLTKDRVELNLSNLFVYNIYSNSKMYVTNKYDIEIYDEENERVSDLTEGKYLVKVKSSVNNLLYDSFNIYVLDKLSNECFVSNLFDTGDIYDGKYQFKHIKEAIDYLEDIDNDSHKLIKLYPGRYEEKLSIDIPNLTIEGVSKDCSNTIITYSDASGTIKNNLVDSYGTTGSSSFTVLKEAHNFVAKYITFRNDFDFSNKEISNKQAVAFKSDSDQSIIYKCAFYSNQDTLYANSGRQIYKDCLIAGNIDFIFGDTSTAYFTNCDIVSLKKPINSESIVSNGYVCATKGNGVKYGYIFNECNFTSDSLLKDNTMSLARPWGQSSVVSIINSNISSVYSTSSYNPQRVSRYDQMGGNSPCEAFFREYNNSGDGAINNKVDGMSLLTSEEANDSNNLSIIFSKENGKIRYESNWDIDINKIKD